MNEIQSTVTDLNAQSYWQTETLSFGLAEEMGQVSLYPNVRGQTFEGFGGAFTEAAATGWLKLPKDKREALLEAYFGETGLRYTLGRVHMGSCDFALDNYACMQSAEDTHLDFSRDDASILPMLLAAQKTVGKPIGLLMSPWSPPAFMKTNRNMNHGGQLLDAFAPKWAELMAAYASYYQSKGCLVRWMSVQNEPAAVQTWDSCIYSAEEEGRFAARHLKPALEQAGLNAIDILAWDHNKEALLRRAPKTLGVENADQAISGFAVHWYTGDHFDALRIFRRLWPNKSLLFTEGCVEYSRFDGMTPLQKAEMYAHDIIGNLNSGVCASMDWNLLLDSKGGPNHVGNFCEAPIMLNDDATDFIRMSEYYYIGQLSRSILPGDVQIGTSSFSNQVECTAFRREDGTITAVLLNRSDSDHTINVTDNGQRAVHVTLRAHTIQTLQWCEHICDA